VVKRKSSPAAAPGRHARDQLDRQRRRRPELDDAVRGVLPEDLIDIVTDNGLHCSHRTEPGVPST